VRDLQKALEQERERAQAAAREAAAVTQKLASLQAGQERNAASAAQRQQREVEEPRALHPDRARVRTDRTTLVRPPLRRRPIVSVIGSEEGPTKPRAALPAGRSAIQRSRPAAIDEARVALPSLLMPMWAR
jgi:hypothetical protein